MEEPTPTPRPVLRFADGGWSEAVGNHVALDLVDTVAWRRDPERTIDRIPDAEALVRWAAFVGLAPRPVAEVDAGSVCRVHELREELYDVLRPLADAEPPAPEAIRRLHERLLGALARADLVGVMPLTWQPGGGAGGAVPDLHDELALHAWRLLDREDPRRIRECQDEHCGWLFLDRTRNGSRRWCSSADCGNRARVRRHYERKRGTA